MKGSRLLCPAQAIEPDLLNNALPLLRCCPFKTTHPLKLLGILKWKHFKGHVWESTSKGATLAMKR